MKNPKRQCRTAIVAPLPPPPGGIGSISLLLHETFANQTSIRFFQPLTKYKLTPPGYRFAYNIVLILRAIFATQRTGQILFFSSEGLSFLEKCLWVFLTVSLRRKPLVFMVSGLFPSFWNNAGKIHKNIMLKIINNENVIILTQSKSWESYYKKIFPSVSCLVAPASVDRRVFDLSHVPKLVLPNPTIAYVGWIVSDKGIQYLLQALKLLRDKIPNVVLKLYGPIFGEDSYWISQVYSLGLSSNVKFVGILDKEQLFEELVNSTLFVFPSLYEGLPVALMEAAGLGLPCVSTDVGGCPEILDQGRAGILIEPRSKDQLYHAIAKLIASYELRLKLSKASRAHIAKTYNSDNFLKQFSAILLPCKSSRQ